MPNTPPPYTNITGISRAVMKDNKTETLANYNGNARPGELVVNLESNPPEVYVGNNSGYLTQVGTQTVFGTNGNLILSGNTFSVDYANDTWAILNPVGNSGAVQFNWQGSFSNQAGTPGDTYSTIQFDSNGMATINGTTAYQQRVDNTPYIIINTPRVESTDYGILAGPAITAVGYDDNYNTPRSAYFSVQDQSNVTQQWDFGILGNGSNNFSIRNNTANTIPFIINTDGITINIPVSYADISTSPPAGGRTIINDANLIASGNFGNQVSGGGSNTVPIWSNGTNWYIG